MASIKEHNDECKKVLGKEHSGIYEKVNERIDQFSHYPNMDFLSRHRKFLHHKEGIEYFRMIYGEIGGRAAELHVRKDCGGNVPNARDYYNGTCDIYGYSMESFEQLLFDFEKG